MGVAHLEIEAGESGQMVRGAHATDCEQALVNMVAANTTERVLRPPFDDRFYSTIAQRICSRFPDACVVLFGSRAYGLPRHDSDVDVLVIASTQGGVFAAAGQAYQALQPRDVSVDVVFMTPEIFAARRSGFDPLVREILERGRVLCGRYP